MLDEVEGIEHRGVCGLTTAQLFEPRQAVRPEHNRFAVDREALGFDPHCTVRNRTQSRGPIICTAAVDPHRGAVTADDHPVAVMLDFMDPARTGWVGMMNPVGRRSILMTSRMGQPLRLPGSIGQVSDCRHRPGVAG
jgi:hypothetical protein